MTKWKIARVSFGSEEYFFKEGDEVTIGRAFDNTIAISSIVISRRHCVLNVHSDKVTVTDLKSANGVYVGPMRIPQNISYNLKDSDLFGIGWSFEASLAKITDEEKYVFKLSKETCTAIIHRLQFQSENDPVNVIASLGRKKSTEQKPESLIIASKLSLKRKSDMTCDEIKKVIKEEKKSQIYVVEKEEVIDLRSDSEEETKAVTDNLIKVKTEPINEFLEYEAFNVKQEYMGYDDEPIRIDSDSDSESENWYLRLSQNSPGKAFTKMSRVREEIKQEDSSYSQMDDDLVFVGDDDDDDEEEFMNDIITLPPHSPEKCLVPEKVVTIVEELEDDIISIQEPVPSKSLVHEYDRHCRDQVDGFNAGPILEPTETSAESVRIGESSDTKKARMIEALFKLPKSKTRQSISESKAAPTLNKKYKTISKHSKVKKHSSKIHISDSQKEERKKKLKDIATKDKESDLHSTVNTSHTTVNKTTSIKITSSNRGAFLTNSVQVVKPSKRKAEFNESKSKPKSIDSLPASNNDKQAGGSMSPEDRENKKKESSKKEEQKTSKHKDKPDNLKSKSTHNKSHESSKVRKSRVPLKSLKPLTGSNETFPGKPVSKVDPLPPHKPKKTVRFSDASPEVHIFEIEPGNKMMKTTSVKNSLRQIRQMPVFSLEKKTLMKILKWNPHWLEEQINNNDPPPILGHNNSPKSIYHSFVNHHEYVQLIGDLLLMEIWECLTLAYMKIRGQGFQHKMQIGFLPPMLAQERTHELFSLSVDISLPSHDSKNVPRMGDILLVSFGPENAKTQRFFFVHNVRCLPSPPNNRNSFYNVSMHTIYTEKMSTLRPGEVMIGQILAHINNELNLFEAMEYLAGSPLSEAILKPELRHFNNVATMSITKTCWTKTLNSSQQAAVSASVTAALSDKPSIQMVQGPPGTGKSSVICAMVMSYFYNDQRKRMQNREKILVCATSNAAVDELVIRLLNIRQTLPKAERFRMVRVGRAESMAARARDVSSQQLAARDAQRLHAGAGAEPAPSRAIHEISHLEAKINMFKATMQDVKDPVRLAYCQGRINDLVRRIAMVRSGGDELRPEQLAKAERRIIEGADIVITTLASATNHKMRGLKRRIALCIVDEAGQAIEPETLIPLTLDVTRLTLIGDPQQLPGYICSQRAKKFGLGDSLFSRLASCAESWPASPVALLERQYRMHPAIADYPNRAFYGGRVSSAVPLLPPPPLPLPPYTILSIFSGDNGQAAASGANEMEAWGVTRLVMSLTAALQPLGLNLAVITPYNAHKELIKKNLKLLQGPSESPVEVNTVDSFQGQERDVVVVSLARSQGVGFLADVGRMNVMLTRARHALVVCLNPLAMMKNHQWRTLIDDAKKRKMYTLLPNEMCQPVTPANIANDDILKYLTTAK